MGSLLSSEPQVVIRDDSSDSEFEDEERFSESSSEDEIQFKFSQPHLDIIDGNISDGNDNFCMDSTTDSIIQSTAVVPITITLNQVIQLEDDLDLYEKVALIYLLFENTSHALKEITDLLRGETKMAIHAFACHQNSFITKWQEKLVEALCIINNYQILKKFGYQKDNLNCRFLPRNGFTSVYVNKIKKALYLMCEGFGKKETMEFVQAVNSKLQEEGLLAANFDFLYLEAYLLHWENIGWIKADNFSNLLRIFKQLDYLDLHERLEKILPVTKKIIKNENRTTDNYIASSPIPKKDLNIFNQILSPGSLLDLSAPVVTPARSDDRFYHVNPCHPGVCLIINQENFYRETRREYAHLLPEKSDLLENRTGTQKDRNDLEATFKSFNLRTIVRDNLDHLQIVEEIEKALNSITKEDSSLFICILSHGDKGIVYGVNSCQVKVEAIQDMMCKNRKNLEGKPKILILQSCQGRRCQKVPGNNDQDDFATDGITNDQAVPVTADMLTFWATVPGFGAIRNKKTGTWFIQSLCQKMRDLGDSHHFEDICTSIVDDVTKKKWSQKEEKVAMVPMKVSTLRKPFYLPPVRKM